MAGSGRLPVPREPTPGRVPSRGVPDGLLLAGLLLLVAGTTVIWLSTGLAALGSGKDWPDGVTYHGSALAVHPLFTHPDDLAQAWPDTPPGQLPSPTAFWVAFGLVWLVLLTAAAWVFRWWLRRLRRRAEAPAAARAEMPADPPPAQPANTAPESPNSPTPKRNHQLPNGE